MMMTEQTFDHSPDFIFFNKKSHIVHHDVHFHPYSQLLIPREAGTRVMLGYGDSFLIQGNSILFLSPFILYQLTNSAFHPVDSLSINLNRLGSEFTETPYFLKINQLIQRGNTGILFHGQTADYVRKSWEKLQNVFNMQHMLSVFDMLDQLAKSNECTPLETETASPAKPREIQFCIVIDEFINNNIYSDAQIAKVAALTNLSISNFNKKFKSFYGKPFHAYFLHKKIEMVCYLLKTTGMTLQEISERLNFNSPSHLSSTFKKIHHVTPGQYRQTQCNT